MAIDPLTKVIHLQEENFRLKEELLELQKYKDETVYRLVVDDVEVVLDNHFADEIEQSSLSQEQLLQQASDIISNKLEIEYEESLSITLDLRMDWHIEKKED